MFSLSQTQKMITGEKFMRILENNEIERVKSEIKCHILWHIHHEWHCEVEREHLLTSWKLINNILNLKKPTLIKLFLGGGDFEWVILKATDELERLFKTLLYVSSREYNLKLLADPGAKKMRKRNKKGIKLVKSQLSKTTKIKLLIREKIERFLGVNL